MLAVGRWAVRAGRRGAVGLAAVGLLVGWTPLSARAEDGVLTIRGRAPGYVDVRLNRSVTVDLEHVTFRGPGAYTGVFIDRIRPSAPVRDLLGVLHRTVTGNLNEPKPDWLGFTADPLPAGTYRFYLLGSGASTVSIPVEGLGSGRTVTTVTPIRVRYTERPLQAMFSPDLDDKYLYHAEVRQPVTLGARPLLYQAAFARFDYPTAQRYGVTTRLQRTPSDPCDYLADNVGAGVADGWDSQAIVHYADFDIAPAGRYDAVAKFRGTKEPNQARVALLSTALSTAAPNRG